MVKHMKLEFNGDYEDFCKMLNKIVFATSEWQLVFVTDIFDTNGDKYVC